MKTFFGGTGVAIPSINNFCKPLRRSDLSPENLTAASNRLKKDEWIMREYAQLGKLMKDSRVNTGFTQAELAKKLSLHSQFVSNWERGLCAPPSHALQKVIAILKINREEMVTVMLEDSKRDIKAKIYKAKRKSS